MANIIQDEDNAFGIEGADQSFPSGFMAVNYSYDSNLDGKAFFVAPRDYVVKGISVRPGVAGTDTAAVTLSVVKAADAGACDSTATALHSSSINLKGTINTAQHVTMTKAARKLPKGYAIGCEVTGTTTSATGVITVVLSPS